MDCYFDSYLKVLYFDSFGVEHILKEIKKFIGNTDIKAGIYRIQACNSIMCGYLCVLFLDYMLANKTFPNFTNLFSPYDVKKNDKIVLNDFK